MDSKAKSRAQDALLEAIATMAADIDEVEELLSLTTAYQTLTLADEDGDVAVEVEAPKAKEGKGVAQSKDTKVEKEAKPKPPVAVADNDDVGEDDLSAIVSRQLAQVD